MGIKQCFDLYDKDRSGIIELHEFKHILCTIMKLPEDVELPQTRIEYLWREIDRDQSGSARFEEFLPWWLNRRETLLPYEGFYKQIRCMTKGKVKYDPPAHAAPKEK